MRGVANVSNLTPRRGSKRSMASISPSTPLLVRSRGSTVAGSPAPTRPASNLTRGAYDTMRWSRADELRRRNHSSHCRARYGSTSTMLTRSCSGVGLAVGAAEALPADVRVALRRGDVAVAQQLLHRPEVGAPVE